LERGKPKLSALKRWGRGDCVLPAQQSEGECSLPCSLGR
ncbi:hypothetical protein T4C_10905, partial [Trichinella pseudospiralis]